MSDTQNYIKEKISVQLQNLPDKPGVYLYFDENNIIIYVGKAKNLKNRVKSYFQKMAETSKTAVMVKKIRNLQIIQTDTEVEALVLENNLIKEHKPRYNILLKDDKTFPFIRITNEPYPQIFSTRHIVKDGSKYFGPFTDGKSLKYSLKMINQIFKIRSCKLNLTPDSVAERKFKICLDYHIKKCDGPCEGFISRENYSEMVSEVIKVLKGKTNDLIKELEEKMYTASAEFNFEKAAELRDRITHLKIYTEKQKIVSMDLADKDVIAAVCEDTDISCVILNIRDGKLLSKKNFRLSGTLDNTPENIYESLIYNYYEENSEIPSEIIIETLPNESEILLDWLQKKSDRKIKFVVPQKKSDSKSILDMCIQNAQLFLREIKLQKMKREQNIPYTLSALKRDLRLKNIPKKIECFDISNIQGSDTVASMVVFEDGQPKKSLYRKFIIKTVEGPNDFASMQEVITRRYSRLKEENLPLPELIMVDGGKGQLSSAVEILDSLGFTNYEIIGLAKRLEEVFFPYSPEPQNIPKTSSSLKLLQQIRDEAHRFAITFHRHRRDKRTLTTELTEIEGIGEKIAEKLLRDFNSIDEIKRAPLKELEKSVGKSKANIVYSYYLNNNSE